MRTIAHANHGKRPRRSAGPLAVLAGLAAFFLAAPSPPESEPGTAPAPTQAVIPGELWASVGGRFVGAESPRASTRRPRKAEEPTAHPTRRTNGTSDRSFLTGGGPATTAEPLASPYFLGWSADVSSGRELLKPTLESGGATVDPRSGWVYVATRDGKLICLVEGERRWEVELGAAALAAPAVHPEVVVAGASNGVLHTFNKVTGERLSRVLLEEELITRPVVVRTSEGLRAFVGSSAETLFAADIELGRKLWGLHRDAPPGFTVRGFAVPVVTENVVFAAHADGVVSAVERESGAVLWERRVSPPGELIDTDALATDGTRLFVTSYTGGVLALNPQTGATIWRADFPRAHQLLFDDGRLIAVGPGQVASLNPEDGAFKWMTAVTGIGGLSAPALAPGLVVVTEDTGPIHFFDVSTGRYAGAFAPGGGFSSPASVAGSTLFALSNGGRVYALGLISPR